MNRRIFTSLLIIGMALASMTGATLAWFTAEAEIDQNVFTAGTVLIDAEDSMALLDPPHELTNWNPGDCDPKEVTLIYRGTKKAYLRVLIEEEWSETGQHLDPPNPGVEDEFTQQRDIANVHWENEHGDDWGYDEWVMYEDKETPGKFWWYYIGILEDTSLDMEINVLSTVCLDGPDTGNEYQGAKYTIDMSFEAIQASHEAVFTEWGVGYIEYNDGFDDFKGVFPVTYDAGTWKMSAFGEDFEWDPTGSAEPNYEGWTVVVP